MKNNNLLKITLFILPVLVISCSQANRVPEKPNVILIMTDDQGYGDLACHGNTYIKTPNLDELYDESIRFTNFHVNPFCAPTRAALMTGRFSDLTYVRSTINGRNHLNVDETTMAEYFKASGYTTGQFGKWHLGRNYPFRPIDRGFDQWVGHGDGGTGTASDFWGNDKMNDTYYRNGKWEPFEGFCTDIYFDESMKFIKENKDKPFFVYLATNVPHAPWNVMKEWRGEYEELLAPFENKEGSRSVVDFFATITHFDKNLGRLREFLEENGLSENTIVIFLTDNGTVGGENVFNAGMRGKKGSVYEGGQRVPCFVHWPAGNMDTGRDVDALTSHIDILPTLIDLCDLKTPAKETFAFSGKSWESILEGGAPGWEDRTLFLHSQNRTQYHTKWKNSVVATEDWRLVNRDELYNIKSDPSQEEDVSGKYPDKVKELQQLYEDYWIQIGEGRSPFQRNVIGSGKISETWLNCDAWVPNTIDPETWSQGHVNYGVINFGYLPVKVVKSGEYQLSLRRWPKEVDCAISAAPESQMEADIFVRGKPVLRRQGKVFPVVNAKIRVGEKFYEKEISADDQDALFTVQLPEGDTEIQGWFMDASENEYPAYYVYVSDI